MAKQYVGLFPGQGSQKVGMGKALCEQSEVAREFFEIADKKLGFSLSEICFNGPDDELKKTSIGQPAILTVSCICYALAKEVLGDTLQAVAGHSLGEYSALVATGAIDFADAVLTVHNRGTYMQDAVPLGAGTMLAVLGVSRDELVEKLAAINEVVEIANDNAPGQIVISGSMEGIAAAKEALAGKKVVELAVSAPFHCSLMQKAADKLAIDLDVLAINQPHVPIYPNVHPEPTQDVSQIRQALKDQVCGQVRWVETIENLRKAYPEAEFLEFGVGGVLTGLMKRIDKGAARRTISTLEDIESFCNA